jgi:hypothetical protein
VKKTILALLVLAATAVTASPQLNTVWIRTYGGPSADGFRSAIATSDGGFVAVGYTYSFGAGDMDLYAVKTDAFGNTLWTRTFGGPGPDCGCSVCETNAGTYVMAGYTISSGVSSGVGGEDVYVVAVNQDGSLDWARTYGGPALDEARSVCFTNDGYIVVAGETESFGAGLSDVYLLKVDVDGDTLWTRTFGGADSDWADAVCETADGCYVASGTTGSYNTTRDAYMLKVDPAGVVQWQYRYGSSAAYREDYGTGACATSDGGMVATGWRTDQDQLDPGQASFLLVGPGGAVQDYRRYTDPYIEYGSSICMSTDGNYILCGSAKNTTTHRNDLLLLKKEGIGSWMWSQTVGGAGSDWGCSIAESGPDCYIIAGYTESSGNGGYDGWLLALSDGVASVPTATPATRLLLDVPRPTPFSPATTLRFSLPVSAFVDLAVYDAGGRQVAVLVRDALGAGDHSVTWCGRDDRGAALGPGVYLARLAAGSSVATRKIVRVK